jgi:hypothetical protein
LESGFHDDDDDDDDDDDLPLRIFVGLCFIVVDDQNGTSKHLQAQDVLVLCIRSGDGINVYISSATRLSTETAKHLVSFRVEGLGSRAYLALHGNGETSGVV